MALGIDYEVTQDALYQTANFLVRSETLQAEAVDQAQALTDAAEALVALAEGAAYTASFTPGSADLGTSPVFSEYTYYGTVPSEPDESELGDLVAFSYSESTYVALMTTAVKAVLDDVLSGNSLLGSATYDDIFNRAAADLGRVKVAAEQEAQHEGAARGWSGRAAATTKRLHSVQDKYKKDLVDTLWKRMTDEAMQRREDVLKSIDFANALEKIWIDQHNSYWDRRLKSAMASVEMAISYNDALLKLDDLRFKVYATKWDVLLRKAATSIQYWQAGIQGYQAEIAEAQVNLGYEQDATTRGTKVAEGAANTPIQAAQVTVQGVVGALKSVADMMAGLAQAMLSAADISVGTNANWTSTSTYAEKCCT